MQDRSPKITLNARGPIVGGFLMLLLIVNTVLFCIPFYIIVVFKLLTPFKSGRAWWTRRLADIAQVWMNINIGAADFMLGTQWQIEKPQGLSKQRTYLLTSNHQSWVDILALEKAIGNDIPFFRFFLKQELIYVPILGLCWWGLDYPFMKRHSKEEIAKNPALKGKDIETTKKACERYRGQPVTIMNFMEGTRYTDKKAAKSAYQHLLNPKAGGVAFVLNAMGEQIHSLLNVTVVYPEGARELWDYLCGRLRKIRVLVEEVEIPKAFVGGNYQLDPEYREQFQAWVTQLWQEKDRLISQQIAAGKA